MSDRRAWMLLPALASAVVLMVVDPRLVFSPTTPTGPDLGAHVFPFSVGVDGLLSTGQLLGWSPGWFTGFPLFYFYFPLSAIVAALATPPLGFEVGLKLATVLGPLLLPFAGYALARGIGFSRLESGCAGAVGAAFLFMASYWHLGGNLYSTGMGEFAFGLSFTVSFLFVGLVSASLKEERGRLAAAALALAATALGHVITTLAVVLASAPALLRRGSRGWLLAVWALAFGVSAFWALPFLVRSPFMGHFPWIPSTSLRTLLPPELWLVLPPGLIGIGLVARRGWPGVPFLALLAVSVTVFALPTGLEMRDRLLPYWYYGVHLGAGLALGHWLKAVRSSRSPLPLLGAAATVGLLATLFVVRGPGRVTTFVRTNLAGYEAQDQWPQYSRFLDAVRSLPPGRVLPEGDTIVMRWGSAHAATVLPYWSPEHPTVTGFWGESSPSAIFAMRAGGALTPRRFRLSFRGSLDTPYDPRVGVAQAAALGVRYFIAFTEVGARGARLSGGLRSAVEGDGFAIFPIEGEPLVSRATAVPAVSTDADFGTAALAWFDRYERLDEWLVADGPAEWPRREGDPARWPPAATDDRAGDVRSIRIDGDRVAFSTTAVGVPHLVRMSYFPNWRVDGADGPFLAAPFFMLVVPRQQDVTMTFQHTWVEWTGSVLTALALLVLAVLGARCLHPTPPNERASVRGP